MRSLFLAVKKTVFITQARDDERFWNHFAPDCRLMVSLMNETSDKRLPNSPTLLGSVQYHSGITKTFSHTIRSPLWAPDTIYGEGAWKKNSIQKRNPMNYINWRTLNFLSGITKKNMNSDILGSLRLARFSLKGIQELFSPDRIISRSRE